MLRVLLDTSLLHDYNSVRGVGAYARFLSQALQSDKEIELLSDARSSQPEVIHYPFFDLFFVTLPFWKKARTIVTIHDIIPLKFPKKYWPGIKGWLKFIRQRLALWNVKAIITDSEISKQDIVSLLRVSPKKVHVIYLAANPELHKVAKKDITRIVKKYQLPEEYILYVGDINYNKNVPQLIKALRFLPKDVHLACVGKKFTPQPIPEWKAIETQVVLSGVEKRIHFISDLNSSSTNHLAALYSGAVAYVQPSLYEGFGLPVLEAMQCETPVVCAENSSLIEVAGKHAVFVEPTAESIAKGVKAVLGWEKTLRQQVVSSALQWSQRFSWQKTARQTAKLYQKVAH